MHPNPPHHPHPHPQISILLFSSRAAACSPSTERGALRQNRRDDKNALRRVPNEFFSELNLTSNYGCGSVGLSGEDRLLAFWGLRQILKCLMLW